MLFKIVWVSSPLFSGDLSACPVVELWWQWNLFSFSLTPFYTERSWFRMELCNHIWEFGVISAVLPKAERKCWLWNCSSMVRGIVGNKQYVEVEFWTHGWNKSESYQKSEQSLTRDSSDHCYSGPGWICYQQKSSCLSAANLHCFILRYQFSFMTIVVTYFSLENYPFHDPHWFYSPMSI